MDDEEYADDFEELSPRPVSSSSAGRSGAFAAEQARAAPVDDRPGNAPAGTSTPSAPSAAAGGAAPGPSPATPSVYASVDATDSQPASRFPPMAHAGADRDADDTTRGGGAGQDGVDKEAVAQLMAENRKLRAKLRKVNKDLDESLMRGDAGGRGRSGGRNRGGGGGGGGGPTGRRRVPQHRIRTSSSSLSVKEQELKNVHRRMDIYKRANEVMRKQINESLNPQAVVSLENKLHEAKLQMDTLRIENKTLKKENRRITRELQDLVVAQGEYPDRLARLMNELSSYKERYREAEHEKHAFNKTEMEKQDYIVRLEAKVRSLQRSLREARKCGTGVVASPKHSAASPGRELGVKVRQVENKLKEREIEFDSQRVRLQNVIKKQKKEIAQLKEDVRQLEQLRSKSQSHVAPKTPQPPNAVPPSRSSSVSKRGRRGGRGPSRGGRSRGSRTGKRSRGQGSSKPSDSRGKTGRTSAQSVESDKNDDPSADGALGISHPPSAATGQGPAPSDEAPSKEEAPRHQEEQDAILEDDVPEDIAPATPEEAVVTGPPAPVQSEAAALAPEEPAPAPGPASATLTADTGAAGDEAAHTDYEDDFEDD